MPYAQEKYQIVKFESTMPFFFQLHRKSAANRVRSKMVVDHWHNGLELNYIYSGPTDYTVDGECRRYYAGDLCLINSGSIHSIEKHFVEEDNNYDAFTIIIDYEFLKMVLPDVDSYYFVLTPESTAELTQKVLQIAECYQHEDYHYRNVALTGLMYQLVFLLCEFCKREKGLVELKAQRHILYVREIMNYVSQHYWEPANQAEIAKQLGFSREHFCRYFKQYTGITFREYLIRYRLSRAKQKLEQSTSTELEIALEVGFSDVKQMINSFKKYYGVTPSKYRKAYIKDQPLETKEPEQE